MTDLSLPNVEFHTMPDGRRIAYRIARGNGPALVFLPGYMSDMDGGKATALFAMMQSQGRSALLLDYSGCGRSDGEFADGTLTRWSEEVVALVDALLPDQRVVLAGSSMGGWLMLLAGLKLGERLAGLVGIAAAPDFTEWGRSAEDKALLAAGETIYEPNQYGPEPTPTHPGFWADGQAQLLLDERIPLGCPARLVHGQADPDVSWKISLKLAEALGSDDVQVSIVKDGDHRLSRDQDIDLLKRTVDALMDQLDTAP